MVAEKELVHKTVRSHSTRKPGFFASEKKSLSQDIAARVIAALFNGVFVALAAWLILGWAEQKFDERQMRDAAQIFRNDQISDAIAELTAAYASVECAHDHILLNTPECRTDLPNLLALVREKKALLLALDIALIEDSFETAIESGNEMNSIQFRASGMSALHATDRFSQEFLKLIKSIASQYGVRN